MVLGTQNSFAPTVDVSGAFDCEAGRNVKIYGGSTGLGMSGIASLSVNISGTRSAAASGISGIESKENKDVVLILANGVKNHLVIDNNDDETGWLIAQTTVFLFLVQIFLLRQPSPLAVLPPECLSKPAVDSGQTAFEIFSNFKEESEASSDGAMSPSVSCVPRASTNLYRRKKNVRCRSKFHIWCEAIGCGTKGGLGTSYLSRKHGSLVRGRTWPSISRVLCYSAKTSDKPSFHPHWLDCAPNGSRCHSGTTI